MKNLIQSENADAAVINFLKYLNLDIDSKDVIAELAKHPDYPSLLAVSDVLNNFNIPNQAFKIEHELLTDMPVPFIAHIRSNGDSLLLINKIESGNIFSSTEKWSHKYQVLSEFLKEFSGIVLIMKRSMIKKSTSILSP
jgi:ABC-type bacteriocin/lantibiotic exporter with double-glycine peptidase domain